MKDPRCSFCGRSRELVAVLLESERAAICDGCAVSAIARLEARASEGGSLRTSVGVLLDAASALLARGDREHASRIVNATIALAGSGRPDLLLAIATRCSGLFLLGAARHALLLVPEPQRDDDWRLAAADVDYDVGDYERAEAHLDGIAPGQATPENWAAERLLRIACRLRREPSPSPAEAVELESTLRDLQTVLRSEHYATAVKRRAECRIAGGDPAEALKLLRQLDERGQLDLDGGFIAAEAAWRAGDDQWALETWGKVARGPIELAVVRRAEQRLEAPPHRSGPYR